VTQNLKKKGIEVKRKEFTERERPKPKALTTKFERSMRKTCSVDLCKKRPWRCRKEGIAEGRYGVGRQKVLRHTVRGRNTQETEKDSHGSWAKGTPKGSLSWKVSGSYTKQGMGKFSCDLQRGKFGGVIRESGSSGGKEKRGKSPGSAGETSDPE